MLLGFAAMVMLGMWLMGSPAASPEKAIVSSSASIENSPQDWAPLWALLVMAWGTAFAVRTRWLWIAHSVLVVAIGIVLILAGLMSTLLEAGFRPWEKPAGPAIVGFGALILASRALMAVLLLRYKSSRSQTT